MDGNLSDVEIRGIVESVQKIAPTVGTGGDSLPAEVLLDESLSRDNEVDEPGIPMLSLPEQGDYTPHYQPRSPFRLEFSLDENGDYSDVTMKDPVFMWSSGETVELKTATIDYLGTTGTVYLNVTLEDGAYKSSKVGMESDGDMSIPLYELDASEGVVKDYRHAMIILGVGTDGGGWTPSVTDEDVDISGEDEPQTTTLSVVTGVTWNGTQIVVSHGRLAFARRHDVPDAPPCLTVVSTADTYIDTISHTSAMDP